MMIVSILNARSGQDSRTVFTLNEPVTVGIIFEPVGLPVVGVDVRRTCVQVAHDDQALGLEPELWLDVRVWLNFSCSCRVVALEL